MLKRRNSQILSQSNMVCKKPKLDETVVVKNEDDDDDEGGFDFGRLNYHLFCFWLFRHFLWNGDYFYIRFFAYLGKIRMDKIPQLLAHSSQTD